MKAFRYYVGLHSSGRAVADPRTASEVVGQIVGANTGATGCTVVTADGWWLGTREATVVIYVSGITQEAHERLLSELREAFGQECVGIERAALMETFSKGDWSPHAKTGFASPARELSPILHSTITETPSDQSTTRSGS